jgi:hypothetical protein
MGLTPRAVLATFFSIKLRDAAAISALLLQFTWVLVLFVVCRWLYQLARVLLRRPPVAPVSLRYLDLLLVAVLFIETRIRSFINLRYYLPLYPLLLLCAYGTLRLARPAVRWFALAALAAIFLLSSFRTVDPLSKKLVPTFAFGDHDILALGVLDWCCGLGRDQLAYNLEHAEFHYLQNEIYRDVQPGPLRGLAAAHNADWYFSGPLAPRTSQRTLDAAGAMLGGLLRTADVARGIRPLFLFYLRLPNFSPRETAQDEARLLQWYAPVGGKTYSRHGYSIDVTEYRLRAP